MKQKTKKTIKNFGEKTILTKKNLKSIKGGESVFMLEVEGVTQG